ncbi:Hypothetical protein CINCED_3A016727 [Cinara cedri]|uniref:Uncharacterized protein n=1 Tax=Cinara cedri TaxID=506608 RepID=A0A5E4N783_9HEMI|nr:Hypothetical protein CINCED_3A016727 [Cinara cedri]
MKSNFLLNCFRHRPQIPYYRILNIMVAISGLIVFLFALNYVVVDRNSSETTTMTISGRAVTENDSENKKPWALPEGELFADLQGRLADVNFATGCTGVYRSLLFLSQRRW